MLYMMMLAETPMGIMATIMYNEATVEEYADDSVNDVVEYAYDIETLTTLELKQ